jgi:hypothetical protein
VLVIGPIVIGGQGGLGQSSGNATRPKAVGVAVNPDVATPAGQN